MTKTTGWAPCGARLIDHARFGQWQTQTPDQVRGRPAVTALRHDRLDAPSVIGGPINREFFDLYVETQLAPTLHKGDVLRRETDPQDRFLILIIPKSRSPDLRPTLESRRPRLRHLQGRRMLQLLQNSRIRNRLNATRLSYDYFGLCARKEAPSGTSCMPDGGGGRIVNGLVRLGPF